MAVNKVVYGGDTIIDLTGDTVTAESLRMGYTAHAADGTAVTGTLPGIEICNTQAEYDAMASHDSDTVYLVMEEDV